jgi:hypothetical protein
VGDSKIDTNLELGHSLVVFKTPVTRQIAIGHLEAGHVSWNGEREVGDKCTPLDPCNEQGDCAVGQCRQVCQGHADCESDQVCAPAMTRLTVCNPSDQVTIRFEGSQVSATWAGRETQAAMNVNSTEGMEHTVRFEMLNHGFITMSVAALEPGEHAVNVHGEYNATQGTGIPWAGGNVPSEVVKSNTRGHGTLTIESIQPLKGSLSIRAFTYPAVR